MTNETKKRYTRAEIEELRFDAKDVDFRYAEKILDQLLHENTHLLFACKTYAQIEEVADAHGSIELKKGNRIARDAIKEVTGDE